MNKSLQKVFVPAACLAVLAAVSIPQIGQTRQDAQQENGDSHGQEEKDSHEEHNREVHLTDVQLRQLDIRVEPAGSGSGDGVIQAPATVRFDADRVARVGPRLSAKVVRVEKDLGDRVKDGDVVAVLDSVELGRAKARYLTVVARLQSAEAEYQRDRELAEKEITSQAELLEHKARYIEAQAERDAARAELRLYGLNADAVDAIRVGGEAPLSRYRLTAPMDGVIQRRDLVPGQSISAEETPIHIVNNERMWVMIDASEQTLPRLRGGQEVILAVRPLPERTFTGRIDWISRELDPRARTVRVRAVVDNPDGLLRAGMFGSARILVGGEREYAMVPVDAVQTIEGEEYVFVPGDEAGAFRAVPVTPGVEGGGMVEIRRGLNAGDKVVVGGAFDLNSALTAGSRSAAHSH